jgi:hypothetical protein
MRRKIPTLSVALVIAGSLALSPVQSQGTHASKQRGVAPALSPLVPKLKKARIPVYLPSQLPAFHGHVYRTVTFFHHNLRYAVFLAKDKVFTNKSLVFWMTGDQLPADKSGKKVSLGNGITGFLNPHKGSTTGLTVTWPRGKDSYMIGGLHNRAQLVAAARSVVRVY